jgi:hypothetical protein
VKLITGLLVGATILLSGAASAQYYAQASVTGTVLSDGLRGFVLEGADGDYGIVVIPSTIVTDRWNTLVGTGAGNVLPGDFVTATGYPTGQWMMQASQVVVRNLSIPAVYPPYYGQTLAPGFVGTNFNTMNKLFYP